MAGGRSGGTGQGLCGTIGKEMDLKVNLMTDATLETLELIEKIQSLPLLKRRSQVEEYVDFLLARLADRSIVTAAATLLEPSFAAVWDNEDDAVYDTV